MALMVMSIITLLDRHMWMYDRTPDCHLALSPVHTLTVPTRSHIYYTATAVYDYLMLVHFASAPPVYARPVGIHSPVVMTQIGCR